MIAQDFSSILHPVSESSVSPQSVPKTLPASPSRGILTPEQRELKKQRDRARRDSRASTRIQRGSSSSSYMSSPPMSVSDVTSTMALPIYTTAPPAMSLLSEPAPALSDPSYIPPYSPHMQEQAFTSPYQQPLQSNYSLSVEYPPTYGTSNAYSISHSSIQSTGQDSGMVYRMPAMQSGSGASTGSSSSQDSAGHVPTSYDTNERNPAKQLKPLAPIAVLNSPEPLRETGTFYTTSANNDEAPEQR
ncbi:hypothetical protein Trihar35433_4829 [Trichoderma harzianum]|nr:hypothetical protein Trihar35433_4829 [Trichoderma harzianum]